MHNIISVRLDVLGRKWVNNTILSRSPSAKSNCYILNNVDATQQSPDGTVASKSPNDVRPRSQQSSLEESGVFSKASSTDDHSTASYGAATTQRPGNSTTARKTPKSDPINASCSAPNDPTTQPAERTAPAILDKSSSLDDVTL